MWRQCLPRHAAQFAAAGRSSSDASAAGSGGAGFFGGRRGDDDTRSAMSRSYHGARGGRFGSGGRPKSGSSSPSGRRAAKFVRRPLSRAASSWLAAASSDVAYQPSTWPLPPPLAGSVARNLRAAGALSTPAYAVGSSSRFAFSSSAPDSEAAPLFLRRFGARAASPLRDGAFFVGDDARPLLGAGGDRRAGGGAGGGGAPAASAAAVSYTHLTLPTILLV